ncbi:hypothetical protein ACFLYT_00070 [Nanoarchaeota archaeon]
MIELARRLFEAEQKKEKQEKTYLKALLHYHEGNYKKAARLFCKVNTHSSTYMSILAHAQHGNNHKASKSLFDYIQIIETWPTSDEKQEAVERIQQIKQLIS